MSDIMFPRTTWPAEGPWSFKTRLAQPMRPVITAPRPAKKGAVVLDGRWHLEIEGSGAALETAADELTRFLAELGVILSHDASAADKGQIRLSAAGDDLDEAYQLSIKESEITLTSASPRGVLQGVYALETMMVDAGGPWLMPGSIARSPFLKTRILRSFWSTYYTDELTLDEDFYPNGYLETLSRLGINGVWIHGYLQDLVPSTVFPEFGQEAEGRLRKLNDLIGRAARYGIEVFIYFCEPKALAADDSFWERHPELRGRSAKGNGMDVADQVNSLCTSAPETRRYIDEAYSNLFRLAPGLGGVILITASENHSHCYSHGANIDCPRCKERSPVDVVAELIATVEGAVHRVSPHAKVVIWTWSWAALAPSPQLELLAKLSNVAIMSDFERGGSFELDGKTYPIDEYSMKYVGPSPRYSAQAQAARSSGLPAFAKMQWCTTHELATVPHYPIPWRIADKWRGLRGEGTEGAMGCWIFGNYPNFMLEVERELTWEPHPPVEELLSKVASRIFGAAGKDAALEAWRHFGNAFDPYPFSNNVLYYTPANRAPVLPWNFPKKGIPMPICCRVRPLGDIVDNWTRPFGAELVLKCYEDVAVRWDEGLRWLRQALAASSVPDEGPPSLAEREMIIAQAFAHHMHSTVHFLRFALARDAYEESSDDVGSDVKRGYLQTMRQAISDEIENRRAYVPLVRADARLGYHSEAEDYFFTAEEIEESIGQLQELGGKVDDLLETSVA